MEKAERHYPVDKTNEEWRQVLTPEQYNVTREKGTERPFTGKYYDFDAHGVYKCVCCGAPLFLSETKYNSGSGWPSFYHTAYPENLETENDTSHGMMRTELHCHQCGAHLGHVFPDGPEPTGMRYCINSVSLDFERTDN